MYHEKARERTFAKAKVVSRSGEMPEPTVIVRMQEDGVGNALPWAAYNGICAYKSVDSKTTID